MKNHRVHRHNKAAEITPQSQSQSADALAAATKRRLIKETVHGHISVESLAELDSVVSDAYALLCLMAEKLDELYEDAELREDHKSNMTLGFVHLSSDTAQRLSAVRDRIFEERRSR